MLTQILGRTPGQRLAVGQFWYAVEDDLKVNKFFAQPHEPTLPMREQLQITENLIEEKEQELRDELSNLRSVSTQRARVVITHDIEQIERALDRLELQKAELIKKARNSNVE